MRNLLLSFMLLLATMVCAQVQDTATMVGKYSGSQSGGGSGYWQVTGTFTDESGFYDASSLAVGDYLFFVDSGLGYHLPITEIVSAFSPSFVIKVANTGITGISAVPTGTGAIYRKNTKGYFPYVAGLVQADQQVYNSYLARMLGGGSSCETTITQTAHSFPPWTPLVWNGSAFARPTNDTIVPTYIAVDSLGANTFKVASCGSYTTTLPNGIYWYTSASPGYSLVRDTIAVPLFEVVQGILSLKPIMGYSFANQVQRKDTLVRINSTNYNVDAQIPNPSAKFNNIYLVGRSFSGTARAIFFAAPDPYSEFSDVTYYVLADTGTVQVYIPLFNHFSNNASTYNLARGEVAIVKAIYDHQADTEMWKVVITRDIDGMPSDSLEYSTGILYVSKSGNNATAKRNNPRRAFSTIAAASAAAQRGDLVYILPGAYNESGNTLGRDSISFYCSSGSIITNAVISDDYGSKDMDNVGYLKWFGNGVFSDVTLSIQHKNMAYVFEGDSINIEFIPFWGISNYNDVSLKFKFRSVTTKNGQLIFIPSVPGGLTYTRLNLSFEITNLYNSVAAIYPLIHFGNGAGGTITGSESTFVDCNLNFNIQNIKLNTQNLNNGFPRLSGMIFGIGGLNLKVNFRRSTLSFNSDLLTQSGSSGSTYQSPFQGNENSHVLFGIGDLKLDSSRLNFSIKSLTSDVHAFRFGKFWQGVNGEVNINGNYTTRNLAVFHFIDSGVTATGDSTLSINVNGNFTSDKEVVTCYTTAVPTEKVNFRGNYVSRTDKAVFAIKSDKFTLSDVFMKNAGTTPDIYAAESRLIKAHGIGADGYVSSPNVKIIDLTVLSLNKAILSGTTDGSGDLTITFPSSMPDTTYTLLVTVEGTTYYTTTVHTKATGSAKVRFFDAAGAAVTSASVSISYEAKDN